MSAKYGQFLESAKIELGEQEGRAGCGGEGGREGSGGEWREGLAVCVAALYVKQLLHHTTSLHTLPHLITFVLPLYLTLLPLPVCHSPSLPVVLPPPTNLTGSPVLQRGAVQLNWSPVNAVISGYQIKLRKSNSALFSTYHSLIEDDTSVVISNLAVGERYDFQVRAKVERTDIVMQSFPSNAVAVETYSGEYHSVRYCVTLLRDSHSLVIPLTAIHSI